MVNGSPSEEFKPSRGIRQGDSLCPYLFILCAEVLSGLMRRAAETKAIHGIKVAHGAPEVSHLLFADDSIFFVQATEVEANRVKDILSSYEKASGQMVSLEKTTISFSRGLSEERKRNIADGLGVRMVSVHDKYLGLPTVIGQSKSALMRIVRDKLQKKLQGWRGLLLSKAGREVLIKAVAQSIPTYAMSVFKFPKTFCEEIRSLVSRFWWGATEGKKRIPWIAWSKLCKPKNRGGLGFLELHSFNLALLGKQSWRLLTERDSLMTRVLRGKYFPAGSFLTAPLGSNPSYKSEEFGKLGRFMGLGYEGG
ncbi:uncharacterized protein LOC141613473 [Silene latifolia]|uniref:uncharacterized protein LOC141613473 n=1 Tax=Silene latifolia TaxID=37657 RepID=UPI003D771268